MVVATEQVWHFGTFAFRICFGQCTKRDSNIWRPQYQLTDIEAQLLLFDKKFFLPSSTSIFLQILKIASQKKHEQIPWQIILRDFRKLRVLLDLCVNIISGWPQGVNSTMRASIVHATTNTRLNDAPHLHRIMVLSEHYGRRYITTTWRIEGACTISANLT